MLPQVGCSTIFLQELADGNKALPQNKEASRRVEARTDMSNANTGVAEIWHG